MSEDSESTPGAVRKPSPERDEQLVGWALGVGVLLAVVGFIDGLAMAITRHVAPCPDGKTFPAGTTDFTCYVHPHLGAGVAVSVFSVLLGILVAFGAILVLHSIRDHPVR